jgi:hypothetical protein
MKIICNNIIPFRGFTAINLFGILFVRKNVILTDRVLNHEKIHTIQMRELLYIPFYLWYVFEWLIKLIKYGMESYRNISFEREAYDNDLKFDYVEKRKKFAFMNYI